MTPAASPRGAALSPTALREQVLPAHADQVQVARAFLAAMLAGCPAASDAVLCVSELATNAVLHSASRNPGGTFTVRAAVFDDCVRIEVEDNGGAWTNTRTATTGRMAWTLSANSPPTAAETAAR